MYTNINESIGLYWRTANYLTIAQMFLKRNIFLKEPLKFEDLKSRIGGHWGTSPGINYIFAHINLFTKKYSRDVAVVIGIGHAGSALMSNLFLDGTLKKYYCNLNHTEEGITSFINLCEVNGIRSEINPMMPGTIYDGGELGYSLSTAQGLIMDKRNLVCFCIIGDGEFESGTVTSSFLAGKLLNDEKSGILVPIIHLNGYKMGNATILSSMTDSELHDYFCGLGYIPIILNANIEDNSKMINAFDQIEEYICNIQKKKSNIANPVLIVKSKKGWSMPNDFDYEYIGINSHKVPFKNIHKDYKELEYLEKWLKSYNPEQIFLKDGRINENVFFILPSEKCRIGDCVDRIIKENASTFNLVLPDLNKYQYKKDEIRSNIEGVDRYLYDIVNINDKIFRIVSPDELQSNLFHNLANSHTMGNKNIIEVLNECICFGWQQGYIRSGGNCFFISYEAFMPIVTSMLAQYEKYLYQSNLVEWQKNTKSLNFLLTSLWWTNTYSHQNPELINSLVSKEWDFVNVYFPIDGNTLLVTTEKMLKSEKQINAVFINKNPTKQLLNLKNAYKAVEDGVISWNKEVIDSTYDIVVILIGECALNEGMKCKEWSDEFLSETNILYLSLLDLMCLRRNNKEDNIYDYLKKTHINSSIIFVFHGYRSAIKQLLNHFFDKYNVAILGYNDKSIKTSSVESKIAVNNLSSYDIELEIVKCLMNDKKNDKNIFYKMYNEISSKKQRYDK